jgi:hypothetical protein
VSSASAGSGSGLSVTAGVVFVDSTSYSIFLNSSFSSSVVGGAAKFR